MESLLRHLDEAGGGFLKTYQSPAAQDPNVTVGSPLRIAVGDVGPGAGAKSPDDILESRRGLLGIPSDLIEGYTLLRELHRGGQGIVYQAIQKGTKRKVAIKVLLEGPFASKSARRRFEREIELVARLRHANIVEVFHSGQTTDGRQYCVMDYVRGTPLDQYVKAKKLSMEDALALFAKVCEAVNYAHQRGVIHRDLKPSNILVDSEGVPKVLDFGLAKQLSGPDETMVSLTGQVVGTLPYMSPEQAKGNPDEIDIRTDVYSLGVILYEVLTGTYPYPVVGPMAEVLNHIASTPPTPPSRTWRKDSGIHHQSTYRLRAGTCPIDDEVQTIVLRSLAKERDRRYQSAGELAKDVEHYLKDEPIEAKKDSRLYILKAAIRRNKAAFAIAVVFLILVLGSAVGMGMLAKRERNARTQEALARAEAERERDRAEAATSQISAEKERADLMAQQAQDAYVTAEAQKEKSERQAAIAEENLKKATKQTILVRKAAEQLIYAFPEILQQLGSPDHAAELLEKTSELVGELWDQPADVEGAYNLVQIWAQLGDLAMPDQSLDYYLKALELSESLKSNNPTAPQVVWASAYANEKLAHYYARQDPSKAQQHFERALHGYEEVRKKNLNNWKCVESVLISRRSLGDLLRQQGRFTGALRQYEGQEAVLRSVGLLQRLTPEFLKFNIAQLAEHATTLVLLGHFDAAFNDYRLAKRLIDSQAIRQLDDDLIIQRAIVSINIGSFYSYWGLHDEAIAEYRESTSIIDRIRNKRTLASNQFRLVNLGIRRWLSLAYLNKGDESKALQLSRECIREIEDSGVSAPEEFDFALELFELKSIEAMALLDAGLEREATRAFYEISARGKALSKNAALTRWQKAGIAWCLLTLPVLEARDSDAALSLLNEQRAPDVELSVIEAECMGLALIRTGRHSQAIKVLNEVSSRLSENKEFPDAIVRILRSVALRETGNKAAATSLLTEARAILAQYPHMRDDAAKLLREFESN